MRRSFSHVGIVVLALIAILTLSSAGSAREDQYDLVYIWDKSLDSVLDYKDQLVEILADDVRKQLKIVGRGDEYGVIYDINGSARNLGQEIALQGEILRKAGLAEAWAIEDKGYYRLYNVSYGLGPNVESLKKTYDRLYEYLGKEVGRNLYIEKTSSENYTLIYRRRGDRRSTMEVALNHAKMLRGKKIRTSITPENNNEVVYGESSLLDDESDTSDSIAAATVPKEQPSSAAKAISQSAPSPVQRLTKTADKNVVLASRKTELVSSKVASTGGRNGFEKNIEALIGDLRKRGKIRSDEKTGWVVYDLASNTSLVDINSNELFQAASMIKPFVALAYFHQVNKGGLTYGTKSRQMMEAMIQRSSNSATNWVMRQVGGPEKCEQILRTHYGSIFKNTVIKEYIPANGRTYKNSALPSDYIRFLRALWNLELPHSKEMRRIMALPGRDRLYYGTPIPQGTLVYNKTGSTAHLCGDMGILVPKAANGARHPYAIVGIIERSSRADNYGQWMIDRGNVIRQVSTLVYKELKKQHKLR